MSVAVISLKSLLFITILSGPENAAKGTAERDLPTELTKVEQKQAALEQQQVQFAVQQTQLAYQQNVLLETMKEHAAYNTFLFVALGAVGAFLTYLQTKKENKLIKAQERQIEDAKVLATSYYKNIDSVTSLVTTLQAALSIYTKAEEKLKAIDSLQHTVSGLDNYWQEQLARLNDDAVQLSPKLTRAAINSRSTIQAVDSFTTRYEFVTSSPNLLKSPNANCLFVVAFGHRARGRDSEAEQCFQRAIEIAQEDIKTRAELPYRAIPGNVTSHVWLTKLQNICHYHLGLTLANQGRYSEAVHAFERACQADAHDYKAASYIPEVMFFGGLVPLDRIVAEYRALLQKLASVPESARSRLAQTPGELAADVHIKIGNCYFATSEHKDYQPHRRVTEAEQHYRLALQADPNAVIAKFSLAQALQEQRKDRSLCEKLYVDAYSELRNAVSRMIEHKSLILFYYMIAICCEGGRIGADNTQIYTLKIYELLSELPHKEQVRLFSPLTKTDLTFDRFSDEVRKFEATSSQRTARTEGRPHSIGR
jgi:tetratricopeptide (TPR) repeat protein